MTLESYHSLAFVYDALTQDVSYETRVDFLEKLFARSHIPVHTVLDLACGTGTVTKLLMEHGYRVVDVEDLDL